MPFFSIVIPTYNRADRILQAVESVVGQGFTDWELLVVDDGSSDDTGEVLKPFLSEKIRYLYQDNAERSAARNHGIREANGDFICFLDSDDYYLNDHLSSLYDCIIANQNRQALYYTGPTTVSGTKETKHAMFEENEDAIQFLFRDFLLTNSVCIHKNVLQTYQFNESMNVFEDMHLWLRIVMHYPFIQIKKYTTVCIDHELRGGKTFFQQSDVTQLKKYLSNVQDLFDNHNLGDFISEDTRKKFFLKKYYAFAYGNIWSKSFKDARDCMSRIRELQPELTEEYKKLRKEYRRLRF